MKKNFKKALIIIGIACLLIGITGNSFAHSGRTDSNGGHRDNKNKSGLGSYHYHCGGYPAHLHDNGVCPYNSSSSISKDSVATSSTIENASKTIIEAASVEINENIESMKVGEINQLTATVLPENSEDKSVTWKSTNENIVTVSSTGKIVALGRGAVNISVTTANGKTDLILIDVEEVNEVEETEVVATSIQSDDFDNTIMNSSEESDPVSGLLGLGLIGGVGYLGYKKHKKSKK